MEKGIPSNGSGGEPAVGGGNRKAAPSSAASIRHNLPQIPTMPHSSSRMAVSKASLKEYPPAVQPFANLVSMEELEGKKPETPAAEGKSKKGETPSLSSLPTPPSDVTSETSPKTACQSLQGDNKGSPPTPIKLKIRRSIQQGGQSHLTSSVQLEPDGQPATPTGVSASASSKKGGGRQVSASKTTPTPRRTKTKALLKGQRLKSLKNKLETQESTSESAPSTPGQADMATEQGEEGLITALPKMKSAPAEHEGPPPRWLVGDMVWSKVSGHPWWPCMVAYDPHQGIYIKQKSGFKNTNIFHVQYFGDEAERGWVAESAMVSYEGPEKLAEFCKEMSKKHKKDKKWIHKVSAARKPAWDLAVNSAKEAFPMSRAERKQVFTFIYAPPKPKKSKAAVKETDATLPNGMLPPMAHSKRKLSDKDSVDDSVLPPKKKRKRSQNAGGQGADKLANQGLTQFMVFCQKRRESVRSEHPDFTEEMVEGHLTEQWNKLDDEQKSKFIPMGSDVKHLSKMMGSMTGSHSDSKKSPRMPKKTKKKQESEEQETEFQDAVKPKKKSRKSLMGVKKSAADSTTPAAEAPILPLGVGESTDDAMETDDDEGHKRLRSRKPPNSEVESIPSATDDEMTKEEDLQPVIPKKPRKATMLNPEGCFTGDNPEELEINRLSNAGPSKKVNICQVCEEAGELITCEGVCQGSFHLECLGLTVQPTGPFKCDECVTGVHTCFVCKKSSVDTKRCGVSQCGKFYHEACIVKFPNTRIEGKNVYCPLHMCATCAIMGGDDKKNPKCSKSIKGRLFKCIRCPTAYHLGDFCIAAGSIQLPGFNMICSRHFQPIKSQRHHTHINVSWCFMCSNAFGGGTLLCCESCPASFHAQCLGIEFPEGNWICKECRMGKCPLYGDIVWVKVGSYRWWPGEICHPKNVPHNIQEKPHQVGEFPIHFFGSHDFYWTHKARVFLFQEGDKGSSESANAKALAKVFHRAVKEATAGYKIYVKAKEMKEQQEIEKIERKPPPYRHIKNNYPIGNVAVYKGDLSEIPKCECKPTSDAPCSSDTDCLNRMLMYECNPNLCPSGEKCQNQRFQKRQYPESAVIKTEKSGWGLRTMVDIKKGQFVNEYVGDLIDEEECKRRIKQAHDDNITNFYMLTLDNKRVIDAGPKGNFSRFMNHSCQPNCETQKWNVNGDVRVGLFGIRDIPAGSDLTFNYNLEAIGQEKTACQCGAVNCSGFLGVRPKTAAELLTDKKKDKKEKKKKKKKLKSELKVEHEDDCYRCGEGGELVMCDKANCPKAYHLQCLKLAKPPHGKWTCPWHHCDDCGKKSAKLCNECPNSFCADHLQGNIYDVGDGRLVCSDHEDILDAIKSSQTENGGEIRIKTPTLDSVPSSGSTSPNPSDYESSATETSESSKSVDSRPVSRKSVGRLESTESAKSNVSQSDSETGSVASVSQKKAKSASSRKVAQADSEEITSENKTIVDKPTAPSVGEVPPLIASETAAATDKKTKGKAKARKSLSTSQDEEKNENVKTKEPKSRSRPSKGKGRGKGGATKQEPAMPTNNNKEGADDEPMFDDKDDEFGDLVIDIPNF